MDDNTTKRLNKLDGEIAKKEAKIDEIQIIINKEHDKRKKKISVELTPSNKTRRF